jgi:hypothetical protein
MAGRFAEKVTLVTGGSSGILNRRNASRVCIHSVAWVHRWKWISGSLAVFRGLFNYNRTRITY